ncbi:MAG: hypothetical protein MUC49_02775 [Raineya sp.]|jgi:hypothetical protein|nr:hypothetical protein [Raineya sp.]
MKSAKYLISFLLSITFIAQVHGQSYHIYPKSISLDYIDCFEDRTIVKESIVADFDNNNHLYWGYEHIFTTKDRYYEPLVKYKDFVSFLNKEVTRETISKLGLKYGTIDWKIQASEKKIICFEFDNRPGNINIVLDSSSVKDPVISKIITFFQDYRKEHGCEKRYSTYQLKKGETLKTVAKRENITWWYMLYDFNYNYKHQIGVDIHMFNQNISNEPKEGDIILLPCFFR